MKRRFLASQVFREPLFTKRQLGRIFFRIGSAAEKVIGTDYMLTEVKHPAWFPAAPALDFHDANAGIASKTVYLAFIFAHNPGVDQAKAIRLATERAIPGPDGQLLYIPDFMSEASPQRKKFYEVKPGFPGAANDKGEEKIASVHAFMHDLGLPYNPGSSWNPVRELVIFRGFMFGMPVTVTFNYQRHGTVDGLLVYFFTIETLFPIKEVVLVLVLAAVLIAILFRKHLPNPFPPGQPIPVPAVGPGGGGTLPGPVIRLSPVAILVWAVLDQTPQTPAQILAEINTVQPAVTLPQVVAALDELRSVGAAKPVGPGWVKVPGFVPVAPPPKRPN